METVPKKAQTPKENDYRAKKEAEAAIRRVQGQITRTEQDIAQKEQQLKNCEDELLKPSVSSDYIKTIEISKQIDALKQEIELLYQTWETLHTTIH